MRIIFAGTPQFAADHLQALLDHGGHQLVAAYTQPDRRAGRGKKRLASPVKQVALDAGMVVEQPLSLKEPDAQRRLTTLEADIMVVVAYGLLLPQTVLTIPRYGCINVHASLLPHWRGAAPVERAIVAGDTQSGITIMQMDAGLDTGDMLCDAACTIDSSETGDSLRGKLTVLGQTLLLETLQAIEEGSTIATPQDNSAASYANKLNKSEAQIDWREPAALIDRKIRAFSSALSSYSMLNGQRIRIIKATPISAPNGNDKVGEIIAVSRSTVDVQCGDDVLSITDIQLPGAKCMPVQALLNGKPGFFKPGQQFTAQTD